LIPGCAVKHSRCKKSPANAGLFHEHHLNATMCVDQLSTLATNFMLNPIGYLKISATRAKPATT